MTYRRYLKGLLMTQRYLEPYYYYYYCCYMF